MGRPILNGFGDGGVFNFANHAPPRSWYNCGMPFIVKLTSRIGGVSWLSPATKSGHRTLASRESAEVFHNYEDGNIAIRTLPPAFKGMGRTFSVEPAN
jgi:hypothetical protein